MIFKNHDLIAFQSLFQAELFSKINIFLRMAYFILHLYLVIKYS